MNLAFSSNKHPSTMRSLLQSLQITLGLCGVTIVPIGVLFYWTGQAITLDDLLATLIVVCTLFIGFSVACLYPHIFNIYTLRLPGIFAATYSMMLLIPLPILYSECCPLSKNRNAFLLTTCAGFLCTIAGILLVHHLLPISRQTIRHWFARSTVQVPALYLINLILLVGCLTIFALYIYTVGTLPIIELLTRLDPTVQFGLARENALKLIQGRIVYLFVALRAVLLPYTMLLYFVVALNGRRKVNWLLFAIAASASLTMASATLEKSPVGYNLIALLFTWILVRGKTLSIRITVSLLALALLFPMFVVLAVSNYEHSLSTVLEAIISRVFYVPSQVLLQYFEYFPHHQDFLMGRSLPYISKFFSKGPFPVANTIYLYMYPASIIKSGNANAAYIGNLWADFSWPGVIFGSIFCGMLIQGLQVIILRLPKSPPTIVLQAMLTYQVAMLTSTSIPDFLEATGAAYATGLTIFILLITRAAPTISMHPIQRKDWK